MTSLCGSTFASVARNVFYFVSKQNLPRDKKQLCSYPKCLLTDALISLISCLISIPGSACEAETLYLLNINAVFDIFFRPAHYDRHMSHSHTFVALRYKDSTLNKRHAVLPSDFWPSDTMFRLLRCLGSGSKTGVLYAKIYPINVWNGLTWETDWTRTVSFFVWPQFTVCVLEREGESVYVLLVRGCPAFCFV